MVTANIKKSFYLKICVFTVLLSFVGCSDSSDNNLQSMSKGLNLSKDSILKVSLTDAPSKDFKSVFVNVAQIEIFLKKDATEKRLVVGKNLGAVDLLQLSHGVLLPISDVQIPADVEVREIRLVLNHEQNYAVEQDDQICPLQTPSGQSSGVKIKLGTTFKIETGYTYSLVIDFDAQKSIVVTGQGRCLLKPVIKIPAITQQAIVEDDPDTSINESDQAPIVPITDGTDTNSSNTTIDANTAETLPSNELGFDPLDPTTYPPEITDEDLFVYF